MQPDPTLADIEAGAQAAHAVMSRPLPSPHDVAAAVLRAVLPGHDAQRVERIAQAIEAGCTCTETDAWNSHLCDFRRAATIARAHSTTPDGDDGNIPPTARLRHDLRTHATIDTGWQTLTVCGRQVTWLNARDEIDPGTGVVDCPVCLADATAPEGDAWEQTATTDQLCDEYGEGGTDG